MSIRSRGALIVIEGLDRAGKSTQCERLCTHLEEQAHKVKRMRFPGEKARKNLHFYFSKKLMGGAR